MSDPGRPPPEVKALAKCALFAAGGSGSGRTSRT
jgi:hypothetical protein